MTGTESPRNGVEVMPHRSGYELEFGSSAESVGDF